MGRKNQRLSPSLENYLEAIWDVGSPARCSDVARRLGVAKASVTAAARKLRARGFVIYTRYGPLALTAAGQARAAAVRERHDDLVAFLVHVLGVARAVAEKDACVLEHGLSPETADLLTKYLARKKKERRRR